MSFSLSALNLNGMSGLLSGELRCYRSHQNHGRAACKGAYLSLSSKEPAEKAN